MTPTRIITTVLATLAVLYVLVLLASGTIGGQAVSGSGEGRHPNTPSTATP